MIRLLLQAVVAAAVAAVLLIQLRETQELVAWELLLIGLLVWQLRDVPGKTTFTAEPLFDFDPRERSRLPRSVASVELASVDALSGYVGPERRLRPMLRRLASHRLGRYGIDLNSAEAAQRLGEENWVWLENTSDDPPDAEDLERLVIRLEEL